MRRLRRFMEEINQIDRSSMRKNYACLLDLRIYVYIVIHGSEKKKTSKI